MGLILHFMKMGKLSFRVILTVLFMAMTNLIAINNASAQSGMGQKLKDMTPQQRDENHAWT
jgi:multisubunit Na+/H+ antiporter MnhG subunit